MNLFTIILRCEARISADLSDMIRRTVEMPYVPREGDLLCVGADGDLMEVDKLIWSPREGIEAWFLAIDEIGIAARMLEQGWERDQMALPAEVPSRLTPVTQQMWRDMRAAAGADA